MTSGQVLREARCRHGLTQQQLADRAHTSQAAVSRIERDLVSPSLDTLTHLLDLLGEELALEARPIDYGHDVTLLQQNLAHSVSDRVRRQSRWANSVRELQRGVER